MIGKVNENNVVAQTIFSLKIVYSIRYFHIELYLVSIVMVILPWYWGANGWPALGYSPHRCHLQDFPWYNHVYRWLFNQFLNQKCLCPCLALIIYIDNSYWGTNMFSQMFMKMLVCMPHNDNTYWGTYKGSDIYIKSCMEYPFFLGKLV